MKIVFATNNEHKLSEIKSILGADFEVLSLKDIGCDVVQGFYLSRPIPPEIFEKLVENEEQSNG